MGRQLSSVGDRHVKGLTPQLSTRPLSSVLSSSAQDTVTSPAFSAVTVTAAATPQQNDEAGSAPALDAALESHLPIHGGATEDVVVAYA